MWIPRASVVWSASSLLLLLLQWPHNTAAQYRIESWTIDNGLPQNTVRSIVQTRDGYLWFTTYDGLVRFDGINFRVFDKSNTKAGAFGYVLKENLLAIRELLEEQLPKGGSI